MSEPVSVAHPEWERGEIVVHFIDQVGNNLTHVVRWCTEHAAPVLVFNDGSMECWHDKTVGWSPHEHTKHDIVALSALPGWPT